LLATARAFAARKLQIWEQIVANTQVKDEAAKMELYRRTLEDAKSVLEILDKASQE
jgi:hypothetical protein